MAIQPLLLIALLILSAVHAFAIPSATKATNTRLFGIAEWRDNCFIDPTSMTSLDKPISLLPFDCSEGLLQGQTKELRLYEDRFLQLFTNVQDNLEGCVGMALISEQDAGILSAVPLCEVIAFNNMGGELGIFLTIQCVGRIELTKVLEESDAPYLQCECREIVDENAPDERVANEVADGIDHILRSLSHMEEELAIHLEKQEKDGNLPSSVSIENISTDDIRDDDDYETRFERYTQAHRAAMESDTQGYLAAGERKKTRTSQELTAISWAAFSTEQVDYLDSPYRLQALDTTDLVERLKLGLYLLNEKKRIVQEMLAETGGPSYRKPREEEDEGFA